ncbi:hypothetical protein FGO68_gene17759 [Halteria grandinella]|uniref:Arylamine N-acetyltransferase n=1 Tax=Halteria grandinella TaxID=5974 RepID=A0A8J8NLH8_HALGN|nr:hypothetical protein FGO68_gene17759 [Halteria grandinella]
MEKIQSFQIPQAQLDKIYAKMGIPLGFQFTPIKEALYMITNKFFLAFNYTTLDLHIKGRKPLALDLNDLIDRMCIKDLGALCYEHDLLIYYLLKHLGFDVSFVEVQITFERKKWDTVAPSTHAFVYVQLNGLSYVLDPGAGNLAYRYPIEFDPSKDLNEIYLSKEEGYRIESDEDQYYLSTTFPSDNNGEFSVFYIFQRPIIKRDVADIEAAYKRLFTWEEFLRIRDSRFFSVKRTLEGLILVMFVKDAEQFVALRKEYKRGKPTEKHVYRTYEEFREDTIQIIGVQIPSRDDVIANIFE